MSRPTRTAIVSGQQAWDSVVNDDFKLVFNRPFAMCQQKTDESTALTESNLAASYAAASYSECYVWVNHSVRGYTLYRSNGTSWEIVRGATRLYERALSGITTLAEYDDIVVCGGTTYTVTLPPASGQAGRVIYVKRTSSGTITVDGNGSETIDGALTLSMTTSLQAVILVCDGSNWFSFSSGGAGSGSGTLTLESISAVGSISASTNYAICSGTTYTVTLPSAATVGSGWVLYIKKTASGNITVDGSGSETIDGALTYLMRISNQTLELVSDGTNWSIASEANHRPIALAQESISAVGTIGDFTDVAICSGTTYTVTLPAAATYGLGRILRIKRTSSGTITVDGNGSETIDGSLTFLLDIALMSVTLYCDGSNWSIV